MHITGGTRTFEERVTLGEGVACVRAWGLSHHVTLWVPAALFSRCLHTTLLLGNKHVAQPIRVTFEREQVGCRETVPAKLAWQLASPNSQCALGNFPPCQTV